MDLLTSLGISLASILIVFFILILLALVIYSLQYLPKGAEGSPRPPKEAGRKAAPVGTGANAQSEKNRMVAIVTACCVARAHYHKDVRVVRCEKVK